ncbi:hypothetical protein POX_a00676 [Penicillium oxalicum]|uniref:Uncharacterized protein n=1 Tax=Penicillium oxalicum (strain 114-2 / CGMCC 5302) TaxID=933388 RepID=S7ZZV3_PENO1|nr:hypothetical protein POX_a00676 [Penicillium oxalicum]EPS34351.1 hypothetical protein PDE_09315 [Penicillium oxalicum 114-2]KAI2794086.1 hypothetical protein POX_a00676 [Penicillium oxalicum]
MQYKTLASLLFATATLAVSAPEAPTDTDNVEFPLATAVPPISIISALMTIIPQSWALQWETNTAFQSSVISDYLHGTYPAWASSLPADVVSWASSEGITGLTPLATTTASSTGFTPASTSASVSMTSMPSTTDAPLSTASTLSGASTSTGGTSTSTAGAPAATGGIVLSLAGAAGVLGLAIAL